MFLLAGGLVLSAVAVLFGVRSLRPSAPSPVAPSEPQQVEGAPAATNPATASATTGRVVARRAPPSEPRGPVVAHVAWGNGRGEIAKIHGEEGDGETLHRLDVDETGGAVLLDPGNGRLVRIGADGQPGEPLSLDIAHPRDVAVAKDGTLALLDVDGKTSGSVALVSATGKSLGSLPLSEKAARHARSVVVVGDDVYSESSRGQLTRMGDIRGNIDPSPQAVPGLPMRDGRGFLTAVIADQRVGSIHVFVIDANPRKQRFSRIVRGGIPALGIVLVDASADGTIYVGITNADKAQLLCLESDQGQVTGMVDLPVKVGEETILDGKALETGGVIYSVSTKAGVRLERHDCP